MYLENSQKNKKGKMEWNKHGALRGIIIGSMVYKMENGNIKK